MKHNLHKMMAMFVASIFAVSAWAQQDYTSAIKNADLSTAYAEGVVGADWDLTNSKGIKSGYARISGKVFDFSQTITLPAGQYKMTAKAAYRFGGDEQAEYNAIKAGGDTHLAKLYAETALYKYEVNVMNRYEGASDTDYAAGNGSVTVNGKYVPNSSDAVKAWFDAGQYVNELVFNVQAEGAVKIGIAKDVESSDYTNIGAFTLTRLGEAEADPEVEEETIEPGTDMTSYIKNAQVSSAEGWTNGNTHGDEQYDGAPDNTYLDWCNWSGSVQTVDMYQELSDMPAGYYTLKVATRAHENMEGVVYATTAIGTYDQEIHHVGNTGNDLGRGWGWNIIENILVAENGKMTIGFKTTAYENGVWTGADNFTLTYVASISKEELAQKEFEAAMAEFSTLGMYECMYMVGGLMSAYEEVAMLAGSITEESSVEDIKAATAAILDFAANVKAVDVYYSGTFSPLADECYMIQENSIALSEEAAAAFEEANAKTGYMAMQRVSSVAELEAIIAELEPARQTYVLNALPINGYAFDYTFLAGNVNNSKDGWTWTCDKEGWEGTFAYAEGNTGLNTDEYVKTGFVEVWSPGGYTPEKGYGVLSYEVEVPNGIYTVSAYASSRNVVSKFFANEESVEIAALAKYENPTIENLVVTDGKIKLGIRVDGSDWVGISNVQLSYLGDGGVTAVNLWTKETYIDEWSGEEMEYDLEWDTPRFTEVGATFKFEVEVEAPEDADKTITWSVSNDKVLSIDQTGLLTVIGSGSGIYEVIATAPNGICATCEVYVEAFQEGDITEMEVTCGGEWWIEATEAGATYQLEVTYNEDATNVDLVWSSDDETVATVDQNGLVTIVGNGNTEVRVTAASGVEASITVWVEILNEDDTNGIKSVESETNAVIYDLQGRRVQKMEKGLYIVNGRKVLVK